VEADRHAASAAAEDEAEAEAAAERKRQKKQAKAAEKAAVAEAEAEAEAAAERKRQKKQAKAAEKAVAEAEAAAGPAPAEVEARHCQCVGNCGSPVCKKNANTRVRQDQEQQVCKAEVEPQCEPQYDLCKLCRCEAMDNGQPCGRPRNNWSEGGMKRFCRRHAPAYKLAETQKNTHYANGYGLHPYGRNWGPNLKVVARLGPIFMPWLLPTDVQTFIDLVFAACAPAPGKALGPVDLSDLWGPAGFFPRDAYRFCIDPLIIHMLV